MDKKPFAVAAGDRVILTYETKNRIKQLYSNVAKEIADKAEKYKYLDTKTGVMQRAYLRDLQKELDKRVSELSNSEERLIRSNMTRMASSVFADNDKLIDQMGFKVRTSYIPSDIVTQIISGKLYEGKWTLSDSIWGHEQKILSDIDTVIAQGIALQKSTYEIAKDLERYVNPNARKDWEWSKVYPGTNKVVDYNAQRLARTMISHAYQESFVRSTRENPFIESYRWLASGGDRMCPICEERDGNIYPKDDLPMDHPNGMCTFEVVMSKDYDTIGSELADWVNGEGNEELNSKIDNFVNDLYYQGKTQTPNLPFKKEIFVNNNIIEKAKTKQPASSGESREQQNNVPITLQNYDKAMEEFRTQRINSVEDLNSFSIMNENLNNLVNNNEFRMRFPTDDSEVLKSILKDGRLKTQFETNTSGGQLNKDIRKEASQNLFNTPKNINARDYEKYGYLGSKDITKDWNPQLLFYGDGMVTLKKESIIDRTTITVGDSLRDAVDGRFIMGSKVTNIDSLICVGRPNMINELNKRVEESIENKGIDDASMVGYATRSYFELQYHGDVTLKDIESITADKYILDEVKQDENAVIAAKESGIKFNYIYDGKVIDYEF